MAYSDSISFLNTSFAVIRKKKRRSLSIKLQPENFRVYVNSSISDSAIVDFLNSKKNWLEKNLPIIEQQQKSRPRVDFYEGSLFPYFGELKFFSFTETPLKKLRFAIEEGFLICYVPKHRPELQYNKTFLKNALVQFYKLKAEDYLIQRCEFLGQEINLIPAKVKIQTAVTRWGSCTSKKTINLNWKLLVFSKVLIDYVIIHELCHLQHLNHSAQFWDLVETNCPNYKEAETEIKNQSSWTFFLKK